MTDDQIENAKSALNLDERKVEFLKKMSAVMLLELDDELLKREADSIKDNLTPEQLQELKRLARNSGPMQFLSNEQI